MAVLGIRSCRRFVLLALAVVAILTVPPGATAATGDATEFARDIAPGAAPTSITSGPDGNLWFTEAGADRIGRVTPTGVVTEFSIGISTGAQPVGITSGPDGNVWFTEFAGNRIGRITPSGVVTEFSAGIHGTGLHGITAGADGNLWFTESGPTQNAIGRITPDGVVTEFVYDLGAATQPLGIASGLDGTIWFVEGTGNRIVQLSTSGAVLQTIAALTPSAGLTGIAVSRDGSIWFTETAASRIGRTSVDGAVTEAPIAGPNQAPTTITAGSDGALWVAEHGPTGRGSSLLRVSTTGAMVEFGNGISSGAGVAGVAAGPDGNVWFTERQGDRVGRLLSGVVPSSAAAPTLVGTIELGSTLTATTGTWTFLPTLLQHSWQRCTTAGATDCTTVAGQTRATYVLTSADQATYLRALVTASNLNGAGTATATATTSQVPTSLFTITKPKVRYLARSVVLTSVITVSWGGQIVQRASSYAGTRMTRRCRVARLSPAADAYALRCRLLGPARNLLRARALRLTIATSFTATGGPTVTTTQPLTIPKRRRP